MIRTISTFAALAQDHSRKEYDSGQQKFERLCQQSTSLYEALEHRMVSDQS